MGRKQQNSKDLIRGIKGWEKQYIRQAIKHGHLEADKREKK